MKKILVLYITLLTIFGCRPKTKERQVESAKSKAIAKEAIVKIAFGSCNNTDEENVFWDDIVEYEPVIWIWGGDNIYGDTADGDKMRTMYQNQDSVPGYAKLKETTEITGVWDDHDYGLNDGGTEFVAKESSQQEFLNFMGVDKEDKRRNREGTYSTELLSNPHGSIKIMNLDTRYFRSPLKKSEEKGRRYDADTTKTKTMLGEAQWQWLEKELKNSKADFNLIISSIQFLSNSHGFEKWANFPHEVEKMKTLIVDSGAEGVIFISGDRHISEFSKESIDGLDYPLIDFTSSGLTHSYSGFLGEPNPYRVGEVVFTTSYGVMEIDLKSKEVTMRMMGDEGLIQQELKQSY